MYGYISGIVISKRDTNKLVVSSNGIGLIIHVPKEIYYQCVVGSDIEGLFLETKVSENNFSIYGFYTEEDRLTFERVTAIQGVGSKVALAVLDTYSCEDFMNLVAIKDIASICKISGIGKKGAEKIIAAMSKFVQITPLQVKEQLELRNIKDKIISAITGMGYDRMLVMKLINNENSDYLLNNELGAIVKNAIIKLS